MESMDMKIAVAICKVIAEAPDWDSVAIAGRALENYFRLDADRHATWLEKTTELMGESNL